MVTTGRPCVGLCRAACKVPASVSRSLSVLSLASIRTAHGVDWLPGFLVAFFQGADVGPGIRTLTMPLMEVD